MKKITVVGCGVMGSSLINALLNGGLDVSIVDISTQNVSAFLARGAKYYPTLEDAEDNDCILLNLPTHDIARRVLAATSKEKLKGKILVNTTTSTPSEVKDMDALAAESGMIHLDAAIEVYPGDIGPERGYLVYSGREEAFIRMKSVLECLGKAVFLGEEVTGASITDMAVLEVHFGAIAALGEAAGFCIKNNYSVPKIMDQIREILPIMLEGNLRAFGLELDKYNGEFEDASECTLEIETTAVETIVRAMNESGVKTPCGDSIVKLFQDGVASGYSKKNVVSIVNELI